MTWWIAWLVTIGIAVALGFIGAWFSLRTLRWAAGSAAFIVVVAVTRYGLAHPASGPTDLIGSFLRGVNAVVIALLHPLWRTHMVPAPGEADRWIIAVALVLGYRQLEAWTLRWQAPQLDLSALGQGQPDVPQEKPAGQPAADSAGSADGLTDAQRHAELAAELQFRLPAMEIRSPAILPGGARTNALASIAESSGVSGAGIVSAAFDLAGMFWPGRGQLRARVWMEPGQADHARRVTVLLDNARTGVTVATKTVAGSDLQEAASMVAGYIARQVFCLDRTVPGWCYGVADGRDLGALQLARMDRVYAACPADLQKSRKSQIGILAKATGNIRTAGVVRYELAQLYALDDQHLESLRLHAMNRELHPRLFRGRYRFAMTLEMITCREHRLSGADAQDTLRQILEILSRCGLTKDKNPEVQFDREAGRLVLSPELSRTLLGIAATELREVRTQLGLWPVVRDALFRRDERPVWLPHWEQRHRETFRDGVSVAELLIAVRQKLLELDEPAAGPHRGGRPRIPRHLTRAIKIASFIAGDAQYLTGLLRLRASEEWPPPGDRGPARFAAAVYRVRRLGLRLRTALVGQAGPPENSGAAIDRVRRLPWQRRTASWQAAYNSACLYAVLAAACPPPHAAQLEEWVIASLRRAVGNPQSELDRPSDWIRHDPDFRPMFLDQGSSLDLDEDRYPQFARFFREQQRQDYPQEQCPGTGC